MEGKLSLMRETECLKIHVSKKFQVPKKKWEG